MDDFGNSLDFHWGNIASNPRLQWTVWHFYGFIGPSGCLHVFCGNNIDPSWPYNHH
jgi:hypothetical protein